MGARACGLAAVLTLVLALNHFSVPALLQVKVLPALLWVQFNTTFGYAEAFRIGWPLWVGPVLLLIVWKRGAIPWPRLEGGVSPRLIRRQLGPVWVSVGSIVLLLLACLSVGVPLLQLGGHQQTWSELAGVLRTALVPARNSFLLALLSALLSVILAFVVWRRRWGYVFWLMFLVPGIWLGIGLSLTFKLPVLHILRQSLGIVILAWTIRYLAPAWLAVRHAMQSTDPDLTDEGRLSGASTWAMVREVYWPQIGWQAMTVGYLIYLLCLWDVETLTLIVPPGGETLALRIFNLLHYGHNAQVNALCLVLLGLALVPALIWATAHWLRRRFFTHALAR
jgi:iron(III) transport system permease protein